MKNITKTLILTGLILGLGLAFAAPALAAAPIISNVNVTGITTTSATLNAIIDWQSDPTSAWFELSPSFNPVGQQNNITSSNFALSYNATGLTCNTSYTYNVGAINISGQVMSTGNNFTTAPCPQPPTVVNAYAINTTQTQTDLAGSVNPNGQSTTVWFEYNANPICGTQNIGAGTSAVAVNPCAFTGLTPNTNYTVTLNAINATGADLMTINFSTGSVTPPSISSITTTGITQTAATLSAQINPNGSNTSAWFEVGPSFNPVGTTNNISATQTITYNLTGLTCGTTYQFNVGAVNLGGQVLQPGNPPAQFTTSGCGSSPTITTTTATGITSSGASLNGTWNANGFATTTWFEYGTSANPPFANSTTQIPQGLGSGTMSATLTGLSASTTYNFRACGSNSQGQNCGAILSFTTLAGSSSGGGGGGNAPSVTTSAASGIGQTNAVLNGSWNSNGTTTGHTTNTWFQYGTSSSNLNLSTSPVNKGNGSGTMSESLTGLSIGTVYYFRAAASSSYGTVFGATMPFTTGGTVTPPPPPPPPPPPNPNAPQALTSIATEKTLTSARLNAVIAIGTSASTNAWFEYGKTIALGNSVVKQVVGSSGQVPTSRVITGLEPNTIYFFRAVAENSYGTSYGAIAFFQTEKVAAVPPPPPPPAPPAGNSNGSGNNSFPTATDNMKLDIQIAESEVRAGESVNYTVTVRNDGQSIANAATLRVVLPKEINFRRASEGSMNADTLIASLGAIVPGEEKKITIEGRVSRQAENGAILLTTANIIFTGVSGSPSELLAYATTKVTAIPLTAAAANTGAKTLGWFLIVIGIILLVVIGREIYGRGAVKNFVAGLRKRNSN